MTYTTTAKAVRGGLLAAAALLVTCASPAGATVKGPGDWLYLTVTPGGVSFRQQTDSSGTRGALLLCGPPRGHAHAAEACAQLQAAGGDPRAVPPRDAFCTMIDAPVTARARGEWHGRPVNYTETFPNACLMAARTGEVFALDG
ncbi:SSI family serine proteinase inhibitor [Streptomyces sp. NPDC005925]|uniref:SSI family serine proteinase inhibitor n=1 Tax=Streptomyces sp. NPDC005925 TaxID=3157172 RepID=UPI0034079F93